MNEADAKLEALRAKIDEIDDALHELIIRRVEVTEAVGQLKSATGGLTFRPSREAMVLRRRLARHRGAFPKAGVARIWREIIGGTLCLQGPFAVAVFATPDYPGYWDLARDHFGVQPAYTGCSTVNQVVHLVAENPAAVGILPWPHEGHPEPWWRQIVSADPNTVRIIGRLPFAGRGRGRGENYQAAVIGRFPVEPSGDDCSLLAVETDADVSRERLRTALAFVGQRLDVIAVWRSRAEEFGLHLVQVDGVVEPRGPQLQDFLERAKPIVRRATVIGSFAVALTPAEMGEKPGQ